MLGEFQALGLVVRLEVGPVEMVRAFFHPLIDEASDGLAILENERHFVAADLKHGPAAEAAGGRVTETRIEEAGIVNAELADQWIEGRHFCGVVGRNVNGFARHEDIELVGIEDQFLAVSHMQRLPEIEHVERVAPVDIDDGGMVFAAIADEAVGVARQIDRDGDAGMGDDRAVAGHQHLALMQRRQRVRVARRHAQARDAVHLPLDTDQLMADLKELTGSRKTLLRHDPVHLQSQACDRITYLQRPDLGRRLSSQSSEELDRRGHSGASPVDLALVIADGLSSYGVQQNAIAFLEALLTDIEADDQSWELAPLVVVSQGRVAIGDDVGHRLNARCVVVLIGERPGLSSPDSLGLYLTWQPGPGLTDASRNCISNIRPAGLSCGEASRRLMYLLREARRQKVSGVPLKDRSEETVIGQGIGNFLVRLR